VSYQPPGGMQPQPPGGVQPPPQRRGFFDQFRGMPWWEIVLIVLPLGLFVVGGLLGGIIGAVAALGNTYIARSRLSTALKVVVMLGVLVAAYVAWFIVAVLVSLAVGAPRS
jgi:hypothetical protein